MDGGGCIKMRRSHVGEIKNRIMRQNILHAVYFKPTYLKAVNDMFFTILSVLCAAHTSAPLAAARRNRPSCPQRHPPGWRAETGW